MIPFKKFYMIRHGESVANRDGYFSGNLDVELTDLGREQATLARKHVETLEVKPTLIIHSHLQRARHTAEIINENLKLPMKETPLFGEHHFGDWHGEAWDIIRPRFFNGEDPPNGETHKEFQTRVCKGLHYALGHDDLVLIACHGGVFKAFFELYNQKNNSVKNCVLYKLTPDQSNAAFPWNVRAQH